ncbi:MAG TPA: S1C family serine protease [Nitrospiraceae bacterium]|nr:S1C family serine protease [Nitrospiraceae bacterium]
MPVGSHLTVNVWPEHSSRIVLLFIVWLLAAAPTAVAQSADLSDALDRAKHATVGVLEENQDQRTPERPGKIAIRGTGFHLRDGYLVTARHAVERNGVMGKTIPSQIRVMTTDLNELPATLVGQNAYVDVVVYRVADQHRGSLRAATEFAAHEGKAGDEVFTVGYPLGWGPTMAFGRLGNTNTFLQTVDARLLQADLSVCSGNSGGALYNVVGEVIGLMHAIIQTEKDQQEAHCSRMAFAVPAPLAQRIVQAAVDGKPLSFSRLGIHMTTVKDGTKWRVAVREAVEPAKSAGVQKTDIIVAIDETEIADAAQLKNYLIERTTPGQQVKLRVRRGDVELTFPITLAGG